MLRGLLRPSELAALERGIEANLASLSPLGLVASPSDDPVHASRTWRTSPPFEGLAARLPAGAAMVDPLFPLVWPRGR